MKMKKIFLLIFLSAMMILGSGSAVQFMNHPGTFLTCDTLIPLDNKQGPPSPRSVSPVSDSI